MNQADIINFSLVGSADELLPVVLSFLLSCRCFFFFCRLSQRSLKWHYRKWERGRFGNLGSVAQLGSVFAGLHASCWHCRMTFCWKDAGWVRGNVRVCVFSLVCVYSFILLIVCSQQHKAALNLWNKEFCQHLPSLSFSLPRQSSSLCVACSFSSSGKETIGD